MRFFKARLLGLALLAANTVGCTSLQFSNYSQAIRVTTTKPGAEIRNQGQLLGITPAIINVRRQHHPLLTLQYPGQVATSLEVRTKVRWAESIGGGLILGVGAPAAWLIDLATGTLWDLKSVEGIELSGRAPLLAEMRAKLVAVAPPQARTPALSDEIGQLLTQRLSSEAEHGLWKILRYGDTFGTFEDFQYNSENNQLGEQRFALYADLGISHVAEAEVVEVEGKDQDKSKIKIAYRLTNVLNDSIVRKGEFMVAKSELKSLHPTFFDSLKSTMVDIIPNTILLDVAKQHGTLQMEGQPELQVLTESLGGWMGGVTKFLGTVGLTSLRPPRSSKLFQVHFRFVPALTFAYNDFQVDGPLYYFPQTTFEMIRGSAGIGPEIDFETLYGTVYFNFVPGVGYTRLRWSSPLAQGEVARGVVNTAVAVGFYRYFSNRVALRIFTRAVTEDAKAWDYALDRSQGTDLMVRSISTTTSGFSLCFYFPEVRRSLR